MEETRPLSIEPSLMLRRFSGASVKRVIDRSHARVPEHAHDWPVLSIFIMGSYRNFTEAGEKLIAGPSAMLYRAGAAHRNIIGRQGFEQIEIEFDPDWLGRALVPVAPVSQWLGGRAGAEALILAQLYSLERDEECLRLALKEFIENARSEIRRAPLNWVGMIGQRLSEDTTRSVNDLAREARRHPSWLGTAYKHATGEGVLETSARMRVARAACLLRETDQPGASIAVEAGFCDQSHMIRTFRRVLGRLPSDVRADRCNFRLASA